MASAENTGASGLLAVLGAEGIVSSAWSAELAATARAAWRRHAAAKGQVTRALRDGSAARIGDAWRRERRAYEAAGRIARACLAEMAELNRAQLGSLDAMAARMGRRETGQRL